MRVLSVNFINNTCFFSAFPHKYTSIPVLDRGTSHKKLANAPSKFFNNADAYDE